MCHLLWLPVLASLLQSPQDETPKPPPSNRYTGIEFSRDDDGEIVSVMFTGPAKRLAEQKDPLYHLHLLKKLEDVQLLHHDVSWAEMKYIASLKQVRYLKVGGAPEVVTIEQPGFAELANCTHLEELEFCIAGLTDQDLEIIGKLQNLRGIGIEGESLEYQKKEQTTETGFRVLTKLKALEWLELKVQAEFTDQFIEDLATLPDLRLLLLGSTRLTDKSAEVIAKRMKLEDLWIRAPQFSPEAIRSLEAVEGITHLSINYKVLRSPSVNSPPKPNPAP